MRLRNEEAFEPSSITLSRKAEATAEEAAGSSCVLLEAASKASSWFRASTIMRRVSRCSWSITFEMFNNDRTVKGAMGLHGGGSG